MGFGRRWTDWITAILATASTKILLNGAPGRRVCYARGLRQGDRMLQWLDDEGLLAQLGIAGRVQRVSLYADDLVLFVSPTKEDLTVLSTALQLFGRPWAYSLTWTKVSQLQSTVVMMNSKGFSSCFNVRYKTSLAAIWVSLCPYSSLRNVTSNL